MSLSVGVCLWTCISAGRARGEGEGDKPPPPSSSSSSWVDIHGFVSQGVIKTSDNNYLARSARGSFEFSEVGINFTRRLTDRLRIGAQLFSRDLGPLGNYTARMDWYYLDYRWRDWLGLRAGRTKLPFGLYNELNDIDAARVPILLPQSIYPITSRDYLLAATGLEIYGYVSLGAGGALDYRLYGGTIFTDVNNRLTSPARVANFESPYVIGGRLLWDTPLNGLRVGASLQALRFDFDSVYSADAAAALRGAGLVPASFNGVLHLKLPAILSVASVEYAIRDLLLAGEYSIWRAGFQSTPTVVGLEPTTERQRLSERMYVMANYRLKPWLWPGLYYSLFFPRMDRRTPRDAHQHDVAATMRFDINGFWLVKVEAHYMQGTAGLDPVLNDDRPINQLTQRWVVLLAKTTLSF